MEHDAACNFSLFDQALNKTLDEVLDLSARLCAQRGKANRHIQQRDNKKSPGVSYEG